jgi:hypothetical protein
MHIHSGAGPNRHADNTSICMTCTHIRLCLIYLFTDALHTGGGDVQTTPGKEYSHTYIDMRMCVYVCTHVYTYSDRTDSIFTLQQARNSYIHTYVHTYIHTYIHTHVYTYSYRVKSTCELQQARNSYIHTYVRTHIHTYIHTHVYTYSYRVKSTCELQQARSGR